MKRILNLVTITLTMLFGAGNINAQMVSPMALGIRATPDGGGFTGKFFLDHNWAIEAQLNASGGSGYTNYDGPSMAVVGLLEYHIILPDPCWRIFLGPGLHFGSWDRYNDGYSYYDRSYRGVQGIFGFDGILGVEYVFKSIPLGLSADIKPAMNVARDVAFFPNNFFGVSGRYYFGHPMAHQHKSMRGQASHG